MNENNEKLVYLSYDGMTDSLGESQVLSYLICNKNNIAVSLFSFEKPERSTEFDRIKSLCDKNNINWFPKRYTRKPRILSTLYDMRVGYKAIAKTIKNEKNVVVHARSYIPGIISLYIKKKFHTPFIFDMRGWLIDENLEQGSWCSYLYRPVIKVLRAYERRMIRNADWIISLTDCAKNILEEKYEVSEKKITVIPTCVDFERFFYSEEERVNIRNSLGIGDDQFVLIYSGSVGGYYNTDEMIKLFIELKKIKNNAVFLFLTRTPKEEIIEKVPSELQDSVIITQTELRNVYKYLSAADAGLVLYDNTFSGTGRSPTKLAEYWAAGLKVLAPAGVGDLDKFFLDRIGGAQFSDFNNECYQKAIVTLLSQCEPREVIINKSKKFFDVLEGAKKQMKVYNMLLQNGE